MPVTPPRPKGPPLNALRAFEAAARLGGFSKAAEELSVTPGAVTQHIKALEDWVGTPLFERRSQGVRLTRAGARLQPDFTAAFDRMGQAIHALKEASETQRVHIAALPSVAQLWLSPRMPRLRAENPQVQFSVTALEQPPNLLRDMFDWSVFFGHPTGEDDEIILDQDLITPVCAPELAATLSDPDDLSAHTLLIDESWAQDWTIWADRAGWDMARAGRQARFSLYALAVEEARNGAGLLMGHKTLIQADLEAGRLVAPFETVAPTGLMLILKSTARCRAMADSFVTFG
ncbi:MAG: LysR family transcriptional regulator [Pseudomonadota bacterium]